MKNTETLINDTKNTVFGQDEAVEKTAEFINFALTKINTFEHFPYIHNIPKSNCMLLIGNTASGKTHLVKNICSSAGLQMFYVDCSTLTPEGWKGGTISTVLLSIASWQKDHPNIPYVILWDEFDKDAFKKSSINDTSSPANYMQNLLTVIESTSREYMVEVHSGSTHLFNVDLYHAIHILAGSFPDIKNIIRKRIAPTTIGFQTKQFEETEEDILQKIEITDLIEFGIMPELIGRISNIVILPTLNRNDFREILTREKGIINKYKMCCPNYEIKIEDNAIEHIIDIAEQQNLGARALEHEMSCIIPHAVHLLENAKHYDNQINIAWENDTYTYETGISECSLEGFTPTSADYETKIGANKYMDFNEINIIKLLKQLTEEQLEAIKKQKDKPSNSEKNDLPDTDTHFVDMNFTDIDPIDIEPIDIDISSIDTDLIYQDLIDCIEEHGNIDEIQPVPEIIESTLKHGIACLYAHLEKYKTNTPSDKQLDMEKLESIISNSLLNQTSDLRQLRSEERKLTIDLIELTIEIAMLRNKDELLWFLTNLIQDTETNYYIDLYLALLSKIYDKNTAPKINNNINLINLINTPNKKLIVNVLRECFGTITNNQYLIENISRNIRYEQNDTWNNLFSSRRKKQPKPVSSTPTTTSKYTNNFPYIAV